MVQERFLNKVKYSIIISVYNTPVDLLNRCLKSVYLQSCKDFEVIVIDDGSADWCVKAIDEIGNKYSNLIIYHIENQGVSNARNFGVSKANGDWILFVDSDDAITDYILSDINFVVEKFPDLDIIYGYQKNEKVYDEQQSKNAHNLPSIKKLSKDEKKKLLRHMIAFEESDFKKNGACVERGSVAKALKKTLAHKYHFSKGVELGEDGLWNIEILKDNPQAAIVDSIWYFYIYNNNSATHKFRENITVMEQKLLDRLHLLVGDDEKLHPSILARTMDTMVEMVKLYYCHPKYPHTLMFANNEFKQIIKRESFSRYLKWKYFLRISWKRKIKWFLLCKNPYPIYFMSVISQLCKLYSKKKN